MAGGIGALGVRVTANTSEYHSAMRGTKRPADQLRVRMKRLGAQAGKLTAAMGAAGVAITTALTKKGLASVDAQAKLARQLGTTQTKLAGMTRAAEDAGVSQEKLHKTLQALNKRLGEAQEGTGRAATALEKLGLNADKLANMPVDQRMALIGQKIRELNTQTEKAAVTAALFSRAGLDMMTMFEEGATSIADATKEVRDFGIGVSMVDAARIEAANDAMSRIKDTIQGVSNQLAVEFAPYLDSIAKKFTGMAKETGGFRDQLGSAVDFGIRGFAFVADAVEGIRRAFLVAGKAVATLALKIQESMLRAAEVVLSGPVDAINKLISVANKIPGIDFGEVEQPEIVKGLQEEINIARQAVELGKQDIMKTLAKPFPGEAIREWAEIVKIQSERAAKSVVEARSKMGGMPDVGGTGGEGDGEDEEAEENKKNYEAKLERLREYLATRRELEIEDHEKRLEWLAKIRENELISEEEHRRMKEQIEQKHTKNLANIKKAGMNRVEKFLALSSAKQAAIVAGGLADITQHAASESKTAFQINRAAAVAQATVKGYAAAVSAWDAGMSVGGPYAPVIAAAYTAASLAKTWAQISSIKSQTFSGGGGAGGGGGAPSASPAASGAAAGSTGTYNAGGETQSVAVTINMDEGAMYSGKQIRGLIEAINDEVGSGMVLRTAS